MIEEDLERNKKKRKKPRRKRNNDRAYPSISRASSKIDPAAHAANLELKEELNQLRTMLKETQKDLASYKCPTAAELESKKPTITNEDNSSEQDRPRETLERKILEPSPVVENPNSTIIEPVRSI